MKKIPRCPFPRLYPQLLGASWGYLAEAVRRLHGEGQAALATGTFRVRHGDVRLALMLARLAGLPAAGEAVEVRLAVIPRRHGEEWRRTFGGRPLVSYQRAGPNRLLAEQLGPLALRFRLEVMDGALVYHPAGAALHLGLLRFPLPRWCAPRVSAREQSFPGTNRTQVSVEVHLPLLGLLIAYEGTMTRVEARE